MTQFCLPGGYAGPAIMGAPSDTLVYGLPDDGHGFVPIWNGSAWDIRSFLPSLSLTGGANWTAGSKRDVFITLVNDTPVLCSNAAPWPSDDPASRGLTQARDGIWTNAAAMTCNTSDATITCGPNLATWVASIYCPIAGRIEVSTGYGHSRVCQVWNVYQRKRRQLMVGYLPFPNISPGFGNYLQFTAADTYPNFVQFGYNVPGMIPGLCKATIICGLPTDVDVRYLQGGWVSGLPNAGIAIGWDGASSPSGYFEGAKYDAAIYHSVQYNAYHGPRDVIGVHSAEMLHRAMYRDGGVFIVQGPFNRAGDTPEEAHVLYVEWRG